jgi:hypothetical protein
MGGISDTVSAFGRLRGEFGPCRRCHANAALRLDRVQTVIDWQQNNAVLAKSIEWLKNKVSTSLDAKHDSASNVEVRRY